MMEALKRQVYVYRLLAVDGHKNTSSSKLMSVRPYDNGQRGKMTDLNVNLEYEPLDWATIENPDGYKRIIDILATYDAYGKIDMENVKALIYLKVITAEEFSFLDSSQPYEIAAFLKERANEIWGSEVQAQVQLTWSCDNTSQLVDYQIFRSVKGSALALYKTIPVEELNGNHWIDRDTKSGNRYIYQVMARYLGGGFSERSKPVMVKLPK